MRAVYTNGEFGGAMNPERPDGGQLNALLQSFTRLDQLLDRGRRPCASDLWSGSGARSISRFASRRRAGQGRTGLASQRPPFWIGCRGRRSPPRRFPRSDFAAVSVENRFRPVALRSRPPPHRIAPELDLRYERVYAFLQDDVTRRRPTVDLALNLLCATASEKIARRAHFSSHAPLVRLGLIQLVTDANPLQPPLLAHYLKLDERIVRFLIDEPGSDPRLEAVCRFVEPTAMLDALVLPEPVKRGLRTLVDAARQTGEPPTFNFHGPRGSGKGRAAEALAGELGKRLVIVKLGLAPTAKLDFQQAVRLACREALLQDAVLYLEAGEAWRDEGGEAQYGVLLGCAGRIRSRAGHCSQRAPRNAGSRPRWRPHSGAVYASRRRPTADLLGRQRGPGRHGRSRL